MADPPTSIPGDSALLLASALPDAHRDLVLRAERWLTRQGCSVVLRDPMRTYLSEQPDAIGWRNDSGISILIECKVSRADFLADRSKPFRQRPETGMGDWRFYLTPAGLIHPRDLPPGWGLLWVTTRQVRAVHGVPSNTVWRTNAPFTADKRAESRLLVTALRRLALRGYLPAVYEGLLPDSIFRR